MEGGRSGKEQEHYQTPPLPPVLAVADLPVLQEDPGGEEGAAHHHRVRGGWQWRRDGLCAYHVIFSLVIVFFHDLIMIILFPNLGGEGKSGVSEGKYSLEGIPVSWAESGSQLLTFLRSQGNSSRGLSRPGTLTQ